MSEASIERSFHTVKLTMQEGGVPFILLVPANLPCSSVELRSVVGAVVASTRLDVPVFPQIDERRGPRLLLEPGEAKKSCCCFSLDRQEALFIEPDVLCMCCHDGTLMRVYGEAGWDWPGVAGLS